MLGPLVALLLLTSPAGPVDQSCWLLCNDSGSRGPTVGERFQQQQTEERLQRLEEDSQRRRYQELFPTTPSSGSGYGSGYGSSSLDCYVQHRC